MKKTVNISIEEDLYKKSRIKIKDLGLSSFSGLVSHALIKLHENSI